MQNKNNKATSTLSVKTQRTFVSLLNFSVKRICWNPVNKQRYAEFSMASVDKEYNWGSHSMNKYLCKWNITKYRN